MRDVTCQVPSEPVSRSLAGEAVATKHTLVGVQNASFLTVGSVLCVLVAEETPLWVLSVFQTLRAIGVSGLIGPLTTFSLSKLGPLVPHGSSATVIVRQVAATFGTAIMVLCVSSFAPLAAAGDVGAAFPYQAAFAFSALMAVISMGIIIARVK